MCCSTGATAAGSGCACSPGTFRGPEQRIRVHSTTGTVATGPKILPQKYLLFSECPKTFQGAPLTSCCKTDPTRELGALRECCFVA